MKRFTLNSTLTVQSKADRAALCLFKQCTISMSNAKKGTSKREREREASAMQTAQDDDKIVFMYHINRFEAIPPMFCVSTNMQRFLSASSSSSFFFSLSLHRDLPPLFFLSFFAFFRLRYLTSATCIVRPRINEPTNHCH